MITKELAMSLKPGTELWHNTETNADGTPKRARVNGKCHTLKRTPEFWRLPMKHGLRDTFDIGWGSRNTRVGPQHWSLPERWEIERHWRD
jgi:hypothetical protein